MRGESAEKAMIVLSDPFDILVENVGRCVDARCPLTPTQGYSLLDYEY